MHMMGLPDVETEMAIEKRELDQQALRDATRRPPILLDPKPGEKWVALVDRQPVAYGRTLKEAKTKCLEIRPGAVPSMLLIADLWELGFFRPSAEDGTVAERAPDL
jgi:hypothetical protein